MPSARSSVLAGTALALILAATAHAAPATSAPSATTAPQSAPAIAPSSPTFPFDEGIRFRGALPATDGIGRELRRETAAPPAPATIAPSPAPVGDKLRELLASRRYEQFVARKTDREAIAAFYRNSRNFQPLWIGHDGPSGRAKRVIDHLRTVDADGLDPRDYPAPNFAHADAAAQAEAELKFTATVLTYARHALNGRVHFSRVGPSIEYKLAFDADDVLKKISSSNDPARTLASLNPQQPGYLVLKAKLAELRRTPVEGGAVRFEKGPVLRHHRDRRGRETVMADARVPRLRQRLGLAAEPNMNYDRSLASAVAKFQEAHSLQPTGQLNGATIEALNGPSRSQQIDAVVATMERWRWMPRELGRTHVVLNIPDYNLRVYHDGVQVWQTRVVVGKPANQTPLLTETMKFITVNPTWNVPQSIIYNELLPIYESSDPQVFERMGLKVERDQNGDIRVFQPPGERNALGQIRFNFPNKFLVYQHDTPERHYFARERRAYSHGCMRVQNPLKYAEVLLSYASPRSGYSQAGIRQTFGGPERQIDFHTPIPVHITYQTAFVDERSGLQLRDDVYGLDAKLISILQSRERAVADAAIERPADPNFKPTPEAAQRLKNVARGNVHSPFALFERLFR
jgi:murein L,D-transpeptidase YcbB/YkuD